MKSRHLESREIPVPQPATTPEWDEYWRWRQAATSVDAWAAWSASAARTRAIMESACAPANPMAMAVLRNALEALQSATSFTSMKVRDRNPKLIADIRASLATSEKGAEHAD